jgi:hypothetical protein
MVVLVKTRIEYRGAIAALMKRREFNNTILKPGWEKTGIHWSQHFWKKHFTEAGAAEYAYLPRAGQLLPRGSKRWKHSYTGRKAQKMGHTLPLVWSGQLMRESRHQMIRATSKGVAVRMRARKANWRNPRSRINMAEELRKVSLREQRELRKVLDRGMQTEIDRSRAHITKTI